MLRGFLIEREIKRCRYTKALQLLDGPLGWPSTGLSKLLRVDALFYSGKPREAETILRGMVETEHAAHHKTLAFEHLGRVLLAQGRYDEAQRAFEAAAKLMPGRSAACAGLAEVRLLQGMEPVQALRDAERALELYRASLAERKTARERLAIIRGNQAWALAALGRSVESLQAIEAGAREMAPDYMPEAAGFYWRAGMAMLAIENSTAALGHFRRAAELDPEGYYGRMAAKCLSRHSVWGAVAVAGSRG
jgi:tetratricopeptide (TPR) repeat protein